MTKQPDRRYWRNDANIHIWDYSLGMKDGRITQDTGTYKAMRKLMVAMGFSFHQDPYVKKRYSSIAKNHHCGERGGIAFQSEIGGCKIELRIFEPQKAENKYGGQYDFDRLKKMTYLATKRFHFIYREIRKLLDGRGYICVDKPVLDAPGEVERHRAELADFQGPHFYNDDQYPSYNCTDADGVRMRDGDFRYFRDYNGYLLRGTVYRNINNMWWVVLNKHAYRNVANFHLFTYDPEKHPRRRIANTPDRLKRLLSKAVEAEDFEKAIHLRNALRKVAA